MPGSLSRTDLRAGVRSREHLPLADTVYERVLRTQQADVADDALVTHSSVGQFVTGQLMRIDPETSCATIINAGSRP